MYLSLKENYKKNLRITFRKNIKSKKEFSFNFDLQLKNKKWKNEIKRF